MTARVFPFAARAVATLLVLCPVAFTVSAAPPGDLVPSAVFAWAAKDYQRQIQPSGRPAREYYAISNGGVMPGTVFDRSVAAVEFPEVAGVLAQHLGRQNYFLAPNASSADLLLVVHWGTTVPFADTNERFAMDQLASAMGQMNVAHPPGRFGGALPSGQPGIGPDGSPRNPIDSGSLLLELQMFQSMRQRALLPTAQLLGYVSAVDEANDLRRYFTNSTFNELIAEVSDPRYYIIVSAYDFRKTVHEQKAKLLWQTRISITSRGLRFRDHFGDMLASGVRYYGKDMKKQLIRRNLRDVRVDIGEATVVGVAGPSP
jgi:hypothetical protein